MTHFLKKTKVLLVMALFFGGTDSLSAAEDTIETRIQAARSLQQVHTLGKDEFEKRQQTWTSLKEGQDALAKKHSVEALRELYTLIASRCCELTGLTTEWGTNSLRIKRGFFDDISQVYEDFRKGVSGLISALSHQGRLTEDGGEIYGKIMAWSGQRAVFYAHCFDLYKSDSVFKPSGTGHAVAGYSGGLVSAAWLGEYFNSTNINLMLLSISKEEQEEAVKLSELMKQFHDSLGISSVNYGPLESASVQKERDALEGNLPIHKVREYLDDSSFWAGTIPEELKSIRPTNRSSVLAETTEPTSSEALVGVPASESSKALTEKPVVEEGATREDEDHKDD